MAARTTIEVEGRSVSLSSPDRVVFPEQGWTKRDVAEHFVRCLPGAFRGVRDRPCVLKRWPHGVGEPPFFQKRAPASAKATALVYYPSGRSARMFVPREPADVLEMVQLGCIDLNPWAVRADDLDRPDELRVDLDPSEGSGFEEVRAVAAVCRDVLDEHGLAGWPKTSGSRGIHIYARIEPRWTFTEVRRACLALGREVERRSPELATTAWWKEERHGVFVDYNQNARDRTIASAYSVRPTGLVSTPFRWAELATVDPAEYTLTAFPVRWDSVRDLTEGIDEAVGVLDGLLELSRRDEEQGLGDAPWPPHFPKQPGEPRRVMPSRRKRSSKGAGD